MAGTILTMAKRKENDFSVAQKPGEDGVRRGEPEG
jgi:hypothetical protein